MSDLDRLLNTLVAEVNTSTRAPGAPSAVRQAKRRHATTAAAAALLMVAAIGGVAALTGSGGERDSLINQPAAPSAKPTGPESFEERPLSAAAFRDQVGEALTAVPGWALNDSDPTMLNPCGGSWASTAQGGSGGNFDIPSAGAGRQVWSESLGFPTSEGAADAVVTLAENLTSCTTLTWRIQPIAQTGALLATSPLGAVWIRRNDAGVAILQVPTADGPPPLEVQVGIAELIAAPIS